MNKLILTKGLPASGKSTWARELLFQQNARKAVEIVNVNRDDIRLMLFGAKSPPNYKFTKANERLVTDVQNAAMEVALSKNLDIIVSDTNLNSRTIDRFKTWAKTFNYALVIQDEFLDVELDELVRRDMERADSVGESVIRTMHGRYVKPTQQYVPDTSKPFGYVFDIDGTVAEMGDRSPYDWDRVGEDTVYKDIMDMANRLNNEGAKIIFLSGRDGKAFAQTVDWLNKHRAPRDYALFMREAGDMRKDSVVKQEIFFNHVAQNWNVQAAFDDRQQVVDMWESIGLRVFQVKQHHF